MTRIQTDLFKSGVPVVYFTYEGSENSIYCDEDGMSCSIGCKEGSWIGFNTIDIANVPNFNGDESGMAHYMPDVFPYHGAYYMNVEMGELHKEDYKKGLGLVEYDDCIVYYSK